MSLFGPIRLRRGYYHCGHCRRGHCPWDGVLGLGGQKLTPAAREVVCLAGVQASFAEAATKALQKLCGLHLSESTVERATEAAGAEVGARLAAGETFGPRKSWGWHRDAEGQTCGYVTIDATGVPQQGPGGSPAEGRMAYVAAVYNPLPEEWAWRHPAARCAGRAQARYLAGLGPLSALAEPLRRQAAQVGTDRAQRWIALSDGGSGLEEFLRTNFARVEAVILDFFHVAERLNELARALWPGDEGAAEAGAAAWCHPLKHEGGTAVRETLRELRPPSGRWSAAARECYREQLQYFENQVHRMDYPAYLSKGWQIGSGPVERACKRVVGQRLKGAGMRWGESGSDSVCHLRALFLSDDDQWDAFWHSSAA